MNTVLNVKLDPVLKAQAQETAKAVGLPISTVVAAGLREFVRTRTITFSDTPRLKPALEDHLLALQGDPKRDDLSPGFSNLKDARKWLETNR